MRHITLIVAALTLAIAAPAIADKGGTPHGGGGGAGTGGSPAKSDPSCTVTPNQVAVGQSYVVSAVGLPTTDPVWLIVQPPSAYSTVDQVYVSSDGSWSGPEAANQPGTWTYTFSGLMANNKYGTVASCSVQAS